MFLSAELHGLEWVFTYEPQKSDFRGGLDGAHPTSSRDLHEALTRPRGSGGLTSEGRGESPPDIPRQRRNSNNDQARAGLLEPGVYQITVTRDELDDYLRGIQGIANSPTFANIVAETNSGMLAQDVAMAKMIWLARYLDPKHDVDTHPPGVVLAESNLQAMQRARNQMRDENGRVSSSMWEAALGPDWAEKCDRIRDEGSPIGPTRRLPEPTYVEGGNFVGIH